MNPNLYDLEDLQANVAQWGDRVQANFEKLTALAQIRMPATLGENASAFDAVYMSAGDGRVYRARSDSANTLPAIGLLVTSGTTAGAGRVITSGLVTNPAWGWTGRRLVIVSSATAGQLTEVTQPLQVGPQTLNQVMGISLTATTIMLCPQPLYQVSYRMASYTIAGRPATGDFAGQEIFLSNAGTGGRIAYWSTTSNWRYVVDDSVVS